MGERLAGGNVAVALLANTPATGAALVALILAFGPISGQIPAQSPIFEADFGPNAFGYRPKRSPQEAIQKVHKLVCEGYTNVVLAVAPSNDRLGISTLRLRIIGQICLLPGFERTHTDSNG